MKLRRGVLSASHTSTSWHGSDSFETRSLNVLTDRTRYRLTGLVFLVASAAVILPMAFDGDGVESVRLEALPAADFQVERDAQPAPDFAPVVAVRDELREAIDEDGYDRSTLTRVGEPVLLPDDGDGRGVAADLKWAVQVASFSQEENATALRDRLRGDGYNAFLSNIKQHGERATRVAVGPLIDAEDAATLRSELDERYELESVVMRFSP